MFEQSFVDAKVKTNKSWTILISTAIQVGMVAAAIIIPLLNPELLPKTTLQSMLTAPPPPPPRRRRRRRRAPWCIYKKSSRASSTARSSWRRNRFRKKLPSSRKMNCHRPASALPAVSPAACQVARTVAWSAACCRPPTRPLRRRRPQAGSKGRAQAHYRRRKCPDGHVGLRAPSALPTAG